MRLNREMQNLLTELLQRGYDAERHADRAKMIARQIRDVRVAQISAEGGSSLDQLADIERKYAKTIDSIQVAHDYYVGAIDLHDIPADETQHVGVFLAHGSSAFHVTTTTFCPLLSEALKLYDASPTEARAQFGFETAQELGFYFLQNVPPAFAADTTVQSPDGAASVYTRTFIAPINFVDLLSDRPERRLRGWLMSLLYVVVSIRFLYEKGYRILGGGGVVPAITSHGTLSRFKRLYRYRGYGILAELATRLGIFSMGSQIGMLGMIRKDGLDGILDHICEILSSFDYSIMQFTSGHTGTVALSVRTMQHVIDTRFAGVQVEPVIGFLGAGGSISRATLDIIAQDPGLAEPQYILFDIDRTRLRKSEKLLQTHGKAFSAINSFEELMLQSDIVFSAITMYTPEMRSYFDRELARHEEDSAYVSSVSGKVFVEDTYPSLLPTDVIRRLGGEVVYVLAQYPNAAGQQTVHRFQSNYGLVDDPDSNRAQYTYGLESTGVGVADYGCGAELLTLCWHLKQNNVYWNWSGPVKPDNVRHLLAYWQEEFRVELAPLQDEVGLVSEPV
jgi:hypothetical protein